MKRKMAYTGLVLVMVVTASGCSGNDGAPGNQNQNLNNTNTDTDGGVGQDGGQTQNDAAVVQDPLCPQGQTCGDRTGNGHLACLIDGELPGGLQTGCAGGDGCDGNYSCSYTDEQQTTSACVRNCGECPVNTECAEVVGGYLGCMTASGGIPAGAQTDCAGTGCTGNATCWTSTDGSGSVCIQNCSGCTVGSCLEDEVCGEGGLCERVPCTPGSCAGELICYDGWCIKDPGPAPGGGPGPTCTLPPLQCTAGAALCGELIQFDPTNLPTDVGFDSLLGYIDYPENGETEVNQYRSWLRRDLVMLIKYAAAKTACKAVGWTFGNGGALGLIDMSEANGDIPGTSVGSPGHPSGTHTDGFDIDLAYFQVDTSDNAARPVCNHYDGSAEAYHCTEPPHLLDPWRTALFIGALMEHPSLRVIGADGQIGGMIDYCINDLCADGYLSGTPCSPNYLLAYEPVNDNRGWFLFHHHHFHVSFSQPSYKSSDVGTGSSASSCLIPGCDQDALESWLRPVYGPRLVPMSLVR